MDNSWIHDENGVQDPHRRVMKTKVLLTVILLAAGIVGGIIFGSLSTETAQYQADGIVIDFGNYNTVWTEFDFSEGSAPLELLVLACGEDYNNYSLTIEDGTVTEIDGTVNDSDSCWGLWYVAPGSTSFTEADNYDLNAADYTVTVWAYCANGSEPSVAVDATGVSIYGYNQASSIVTLSPVATEIVGAMNAVSILAGTDSYSDYPASVVAGHNDGSIAVVGTYTDPSYESILAVSPDLVICDGSQYSHVNMAEKVRNSNAVAVVLYDGESISNILDNIFIVGNAMGYGLRAQTVIEELQLAFLQLEEKVADYGCEDVMITLSDDPSPYVAASNTYADDIMVLVNGTNTFADMNGWVHLNYEYISQRNISKIIIISSDPTYSADEATYQSLMDGLSAEWKSTAAYQNGEIYLICESAGEMASRYGPRCAQLTELFALILDPDAFDTAVPHYIGDDYTDYLTITKDLGYGD
ncbi:MAG: ABC transporter substrate-binding protein [Methanomethylophilus sp.]